MFDFGVPFKAKRRRSLTAMIDVVFLLLVFFMSIAQFNRENSIPLQAEQSVGSERAYEGPLRLVDIKAEELRLNGQLVMLDKLVMQLRPLMHNIQDKIILRPGENASVQRLIEVMQILKAAGIDQLIVVE